MPKPKAVFRVLEVILLTSGIVGLASTWLAFLLLCLGYVLTICGFSLISLSPFPENLLMSLVLLQFAGIVGALPIAVIFMAFETQRDRERAERAENDAEELRLNLAIKAPLSWLIRLLATEGFRGCSEFEVSSWISGEREGRHVAICDLKFTIRWRRFGLLRRRKKSCILAMCFDADGIPDFELGSQWKSFGDYLETAELGSARRHTREVLFDPVIYPSASAFTKRYRVLKGHDTQDADQITRLIAPVMDWFSKHPGWSVVCASGMFFVWRADLLAEMLADLLRSKPQLLSQALEVRRLFPDGKPLNLEFLDKPIPPDLQVWPPEYRK